MKQQPMKKNYFLIAALLLAGAMQAQISPWAQLGAKWTYLWKDPSGPGLLVRTKITYAGDTVLGGRSCQKLHYDNQGFHQEPWGYDPTFIHTNQYDQFLLSSGDTVMEWVDTAFFMLYDFGAQPGDQWTLRPGVFVSFSGCGSSVATVDSVSTMTIGANSHRVVYVHNSDTASYGLLGQYDNLNNFMFSSFPSWHQYATIIEHIGCTGSLQPVWWTCYPASESPNGMIACFDDAQVQYHLVGANDCDNPFQLSQEEQLISDVQVYPNPVIDELRLTFPGIVVQRIQLVNMAGQVVQETTGSFTDQYIFPLQRTAAGMHLLRLYTSDGQMMQRRLMVLPQ